MGKIYDGTKLIRAIHIHDARVKKVYSGNTLIWDEGTPPGHPNISQVSYNSTTDTVTLTAFSSAPAGTVASGFYWDIRVGSDAQPVEAAVSLINGSGGSIGGNSSYGSGGVTISAVSAGIDQTSSTQNLFLTGKAAKGTRAYEEGVTSNLGPKAAFTVPADTGGGSGSGSGSGGGTTINIGKPDMHPTSSCKNTNTSAALATCYSVTNATRYEFKFIWNGGAASSEVESTTVSASQYLYTAPGSSVTVSARAGTSEGWGLYGKSITLNNC